MGRRVSRTSKSILEGLALELKDRPAVVGYNIINEPHPETAKNNRYNDFWTEDYEKWYAKVKGTTADLNRFYEKVINSIREVDKETPIILDSGLYATPWAFKYLKPVEDKKHYTHFICMNHMN